MERKEFDIAVIGAGPGGYVAAIKAAQEGLKVCLIEKGYLGGTCLNVGCIPTKTLLANAAVYHKMTHAADFGIITGPISFDYSKMKTRKDGVVDQIRKSLGGLLQSNGITILRGTAEYLSPREIKVKGDENVLVYAHKSIIATGSEPLDIPAFPCDHKKIFNSSSILEQTSLPKTLAIIGGGYIGCEFASLYAELGIKVIILEALPSILFLQGKSIAETLTRAFTKKGIEINTNVMVEGIDHTAEGLSIRLKDKPPVACDMALVSVGRKIISQGLGLEKAGVITGDKGAIVVNEKMETNVPGIYAIGDVTGKFLLAHVASHQGIIAAANAIGNEAKMHYNAVPAVIFTMPEIATVGMTLEQAQESGFDAAVGKFPFQALGKSVATRETEGFAQVVIDRKTGQILGAQVVGHEAATLIAEMGLAIANELTIECISDTIHAHPTVAEVWMEAALLANDTPIHFPPKVKKG
ncbi:MAG: dihydrolipoyl dehydrogenase [Parachlamydiales bacterium]|nr:dihydrolipoyl dehydrogenase [Candidatus Acheromyda pituitae]